MPARFLSLFGNRRSAEDALDAGSGTREHLTPSRPNGLCVTVRYGSASPTLRCPAVHDDRSLACLESRYDHSTSRRCYI